MPAVPAGPPQALQRVDIYHVVFVGCFAIPALVAIVVRGVGSSTTISPAMLRVAAAITIAGVGAGSVALVTAQSLPTVSNSGRAVPMAAIDAARLNDTITVVHELVPPGSRVFVGPQDMTRGVSGDNQLYYLMPEYDRRFYYNEFAPGVTERRGSPLIGDITSADALVLTWLDPAAVAEALPNISPGDSSVNNVIRTQFCLKAEHGLTQLWLKGKCPPPTG